MVSEVLGNRLASLADGEGHFQVRSQARKSRGTGIFQRPINPNSACSFVVQLRADDQDYLVRLQRATALGRIYVYDAKRTPGRNNNPKCQWKIYRKHECLELVRIFDEYPLWSKKRHEYQVWRKAVIRWNDGTYIAPLEWKGWIDALRFQRRFVGAYTEAK